jgi:hypothetical protein
MFPVSLAFPSAFIRSLTCDRSKLWFLSSWIFWSKQTLWILRLQWKHNAFTLQSLELKFICNSSRFSICNTGFWFSLTLSAWSTALSFRLLSEPPRTCETKNPCTHNQKNWQKTHENRQMTICWNLCNSKMVIHITGKSKFLTNFLTFSDVPLSIPNIRCRSCYLQLIQVQVPAYVTSVTMFSDLKQSSLSKPSMVGTSILSISSIMISIVWYFNYLPPRVPVTWALLLFAHTKIINTIPHTKVRLIYYVSTFYWQVSANEQHPPTEILYSSYQPFH